MTTIKKVTLIGLGAIGCSYGNLLNNNPNIQLKILADQERIQRYKNNKIQVNGNPCTFDFISPEEDYKADLIIIAVKHHHLDQSIEMIKNQVTEDTIIISLLNGISSEKRILAKYPNVKMLYALCIGIDAIRDGYSIHYKNVGKIVYGNEQNFEEYSEEVRAVQSLFDESTVPYEIPEDMIRAQWFKYLVNTGSNQIGAMLHGTFGNLIQIPAAHEMVKAVMVEVIAVANAQGIALSSEDIDLYEKLMVKMNPDGKPSTLQDVEAKRKTEVEMFSGEIVEFGKQLNIPTPINQFVLNFIQATEKLY